MGNATAEIIRLDEENKRLRVALEAVREWLGGSSRLHQTELKHIVENAISQQEPNK